MTTIRPDAERLAGSASSILSACLTDLQPLRDIVIDLYAQCDHEGRRPSVQELRTIQPECTALVVSTNSLLEGAGFNAAEGTVEGLPHVALTWASDGSGGVRDASPITDRSIVFHYEYEELDWFVGASEGRPSIGGPTVDYGGSNDYTLTLALPVLVSDRFVGAVSGDVALRTLERRLSESLPRDDAPVVLTTGEMRVVLSSEPTLAAGSLMRSITGWVSVPCPDTNWLVLYRDPQRPTGA